MTTAHNAPTITFIIWRWFGSIEILRFTQDDGSLRMTGHPACLAGDGLGGGINLTSLTGFRCRP